MWGGGEAKQRIYFLKTAIYIYKKNLHYTYDFILLPFSSTVSLSVHVFSCDWNWYWRLFCFCCHIQHTMFGGSVLLFYWYLHYIYDLILYLCIMYYTVCYLTGVFYAVVKQISMLFIDKKNPYLYSVLLLFLFTLNKVSNRLENVTGSSRNR